MTDETFQLLLVFSAGALTGFVVGVLWENYHLHKFYKRMVSSSPTNKTSEPTNAQ